MKIKRRKVAKKILKTYTSHSGFSEPYKLLIDGTFAKRALDNKVRIDDQVKNYFGKNIKLYTTEWCVVYTKYDWIYLFLEFTLFDRIL